MKKLKKPSNSNINRYRQYCKLYNALLRHAKNKYFQDQLESAKYDIQNLEVIKNNNTNGDI